MLVAGGVGGSVAEEEAGEGCGGRSEDRTAKLATRALSTLF